MSQRVQRGRRAWFGVRPPLAVAVCALALVSSCGGNEGKTGVSLIIKTQTNPYFVSMKKAAQAEAKRTDTPSRSQPATPTATPSRRSTPSTPPSPAATRAS